MDSNKKGATYVEFIFSLLIFSLLLIPVGFSVQLLSGPEISLNESVFVSKIRNHISIVASESLNVLKETKIVYNKGKEVNGFIFNGKLELDFTIYGQLKKGKSVLLKKGKDLYRLTIRPITGFVSLERE